MTIMEHLEANAEATPAHPDLRAAEATVRASRSRGVEPTTQVLIINERPASASPFRAIIEDDGTVIFTDRDQMVAGQGADLAEARHDFVNSLQQRVSYLRDNHQRLHPRLLAELAHLEREFPWV